VCKRVVRFGIAGISPDATSVLVAATVLLVACTTPPAFNQLKYICRMFLIKKQIKTNY
jgi:hypothetical protein